MDPSQEMQQDVTGPRMRNLEATGTKTAIPPVSYLGLLDLLSLDISTLFFPLQTSSLRLTQSFSLHAQ